MVIDKGNKMGLDFAFDKFVSLMLAAALLQPFAVCKKSRYIIFGVTPHPTTSKFNAEWVWLQDLCHNNVDSGLNCAPQLIIPRMVHGQICGIYSGPATKQS